MMGLNSSCPQYLTLFIVVVNQVNTSVYVTGLPLDVTMEEVVTTFTKYGVIKDDEHKQPRVKLYRCVAGCSAGA